MAMRMEEIDSPTPCAAPKYRDPCHFHMRGGAFAFSLSSNSSTYLRAPSSPRWMISSTSSFKLPSPHSASASFTTLSFPFPTCAR